MAGCCFDELPPNVIMEAVMSARSAGAAIFFDPGPRSWTFREPERRRALNELLDSTDVVLMTEVVALLAYPVLNVDLPLFELNLWAGRKLRMYHQCHDEAVFACCLQFCLL